MAGGSPTDHVLAEAPRRARIRAEASIGAAGVTFAGLRYGSAALTAALEATPRDQDRTVTVTVDPLDLAEVEATVAGLVFVLQALDPRLAAATQLVVQFAFFDPPSVKRIGPSNARARPPGAKKPKPVDRPWLRTLAFLER